MTDAQLLEAAREVLAIIGTPALGAGDEDIDWAGVRRVPRDAAEAQAVAILRKRLSVAGDTPHGIEHATLPVSAAEYFGPIETPLGMYDSES